nr:hypothetical protein [uncultured bacterium]AUH21346.1 hypothetical protein [uncultured bacterium]
MRSVAEVHPAAIIKYARGIGELCRIFTQRRKLPPRCILFFGPTGVGKTSWPINHEKEDDLYVKSPSCKWFDGYEGQGAVVLDEFAGRRDAVTASMLLRLLDCHPVRVEIKGSSRPLLATRIYITTNHHPAKWYDWEGRWSSYAALARRIHQVVMYHDELPYVCDLASFWQVGQHGPLDPENPVGIYTPALIDNKPRPFMGPARNPDRMAPPFDAPAPSVSAHAVGYHEFSH